MTDNFVESIMEIFREKAPQTEGVCDSCGICLMHEGDRHELTCGWLIAFACELESDASQP